jgi:phosphoglycerate-specific signal transduction histidine kinase
MKINFKKRGKLINRLIGLYILVTIPIIAISIKLLVVYKALELGSITYILYSVIIAAIIAVFYINHSIIKPLDQLREGAEKIKDGDFEHKIAVRSNDEIGDLSNSFNEMTEDLRRAIAELKEYNNVLKDKLEKANNELKNSQEKLLHLEKMSTMKQIVTSVTHDLKDPLTGIKTAAYYLSEKLSKDNPVINNIIRDIETEIEYADNIVTNILSLARPSNTGLKPTNINEVVEKAVLVVNTQAIMQKIKLVKSLNPSLPAMLADDTQLKQVVINLLLNIFQTMPDGGELTIYTSENKGKIEIRIADTKHKERGVFEPIFNARDEEKNVDLLIVTEVAKGREYSPLTTE